MRDLSAAAALAARSKHPASRAVAALQPTQGIEIEDFREVPGFGIEGCMGETLYRLGKKEWVCGSTCDDHNEAAICFSKDGQAAGSFAMADTLRVGAMTAVERLASLGLATEVLSGDCANEVCKVASELGIFEVRYGAVPEDKVARLRELAAVGRRVLMLGDGLNDAPVLAGAYVSMAPSSAADVGRNAADLVFLGTSLEAVPQAIGVARNAARLVRQNLALAVMYNLLVLPLAVFGYVTPLMAAIAMSTSSILVVGNALRLSIDEPCTLRFPTRRNVTPAEAT